jgi:DNA-binding HxlR family transcriptional regulator
VTFLILREALSGATRFAQFRDALGVAPDVLTDRLSTLVDYGVLAREPYQEPGSRSRFAYQLTPGRPRAPGGPRLPAAVGG